MWRSWAGGWRPRPPSESGTSSLSTWERCFFTTIRTIKMFFPLLLSGASCHRFARQSRVETCSCPGSGLAARRKGSLIELAFFRLQQTMSSLQIVNGGESHNPFSAQVTRLQEQLEEALALRTTINKRTKLVEKLCCLHLGETTGDSLTRLMRERARLVARQKVGGRRWHQPGNTLDLSHNSHLHR